MTKDAGELLIRRRGARGRRHSRCRSGVSRCRRRNIPAKPCTCRSREPGSSATCTKSSTLQQYIGVRFPTDLPELQWATRGISRLTALLLLAAFVGARTARPCVSRGCARPRWWRFSRRRPPSFRLASTRSGTTATRRRRIRAVHNFTPPLVGPVKVGNFTVWSFPHFGGVLLVAAAVLSIAGSRKVVA